MNDLTLNERNPAMTEFKDAFDGRQKRIIIDSLDRYRRYYGATKFNDREISVHIFSLIGYQIGDETIRRFSGDLYGKGQKGIPKKPDHSTVQTIASFLKIKGCLKFSELRNRKLDFRLPEDLSQFMIPDNQSRSLLPTAELEAFYRISLPPIEKTLYLRKPESAEFFIAKQEISVIKAGKKYDQKFADGWCFIYPSGVPYLILKDTSSGKFLLQIGLSRIFCTANKKFEDDILFTQVNSTALSKTCLFKPNYEPGVFDSLKKSLLHYELMDAVKETLTKDDYNANDDELTNLPYIDNKPTSRDRFVAVAENFEFEENHYLESKPMNQLSKKEKLIEAIENFDHEGIQFLLDNGAPINFRDEESQDYPIHMAAAYRSKSAILSLLKTGRCDLLVRDGAGRLPSSVAYIDGQYPAGGRLLRYLEEKQAIERQVPFSYLADIDPMPS